MLISSLILDEILSKSERKEYSLAQEWPSRQINWVHPHLDPGVQTRSPWIFPYFLDLLFSIVNEGGS